MVIINNIQEILALDFSEIKSSTEAVAVSLSIFGTNDIGLFCLNRFMMPIDEAYDYYPADSEEIKLLAKFDELIGVKYTWSLIEQENWIYYFGFRPVDSDGAGGKFVFSRFSGLYFAFGRESGWKIFAREFELETTSTGFDLVRDVLRSEMVSYFENGLNNVHDLGDIKENIGIVGREFLLKYWNIECGSDEPSKNAELVRRFNEIRSLNPYEWKTS